MKKISIIISFLVIISINLYGQNDKDSQTKSSLESNIFSIENCVSQFSFSDTLQTKVGYQFWFVDKNFLDGRTLKMSVVEPHKATHAPHLHEEDEFFFVLEGSAEFHLNGETTIGTPYSSFYCPPNSKHGIRNVGDTELKYLVIKKYNLNK